MRIEKFLFIVGILGIIGMPDLIAMDNQKKSSVDIRGRHIDSKGNYTTTEGRYIDSQGNDTGLRSKHPCFLPYSYTVPIANKGALPAYAYKKPQNAAFMNWQQPQPQPNYHNSLQPVGTCAQKPGNSTFVKASVKVLFLDEKLMQQHQETSIPYTQNDFIDDRGKGISPFILPNQTSLKPNDRKVDFNSMSDGKKGAFNIVNLQNNGGKKPSDGISNKRTGREFPVVHPTPCKKQRTILC